MFAGNDFIDDARASIAPIRVVLATAAIFTFLCFIGLCRNNYGICKFHLLGKIGPVFEELDERKKY